MIINSGSMDAIALFVSTEAVFMFFQQPIDLQIAVDIAFKIKAKSQYLVLNWQQGTGEFRCIARRLGPCLINGSSLYKSMWALEDEAYCQPKVKFPYTGVAITSQAITAVFGQFETIEAAVACYNKQNGNEEFPAFKY